MAEPHAYPVPRSSALGEFSPERGQMPSLNSEIAGLLQQLTSTAAELLSTQTSDSSGQSNAGVEAIYHTSVRLRQLLGNQGNLLPAWSIGNSSHSDEPDPKKIADRLSLALSAGKLGDWIWDPVSDIMELSQRAAEIFDVPFGCRMTRSEMRNLLHEDDRERARLAAEDAARTHSDYNMEYRINLRDGRQRWVAAKGRAMVGEDGRLQSMLGVVQDITEQKQAEEALRDARARLDATLVAGEIGTWTWDIVDNRVASDRNLARMFFGLENDALVGPIETFLEAVHPTDRGRVQAEVLAAIQRSSVDFETDYRLCPRDGIIRWVTARGMIQRGTSGEALKFSGVVIDITDRKRQETELAELTRKIEEQARLFDATLSNIADLAYAFDHEKRVIYANKALLDLWGVSLEEAVGKSCSELGYSADLVERLEKEMQEVFETAKPYKGVVLFSGEYHEYIYSPALASDGSVTAMVGTTRIITERKKAESVSERHRRVLQHIAEDAPLDVILEELVHAVELESSAEVIGSVLLLDEDGIHLRHGTAPNLPPEYNKAIDGIAIGPEVGSCGTAAYLKQSVYVADIATDPKWADFKEMADAHGLRACWSTPIFSSAGTVLGTFAMYYREPNKPAPADLRIVETATRTAAVAIQRKRAEKALRESEARFRNMADNAPVMVWVTEPDGSCSFLSKSWYEFTGQTPGAGLGFGWLDAVHPEDRASAEQAFLDSMDAKRAYRTEFRLRRKDGAYRWALDAATPRLASDGQFLGFIGSVIDITERKQVEATLREAKETAEAAALAKDRFLAVLSHELRTPLTPVLMTVAALEADPELPLSVRDDMALIRRNVELETKLIDDLLDLSRITSGKLSLRLEPVDLDDVVRQVCGICRQQIVEKNICLTLNLSGESNRVTADPARLQQILWNLLKNAVKFTPENGHILVTTGRTASGQLQVQVQDSGIGIESEQQARIFDAFEQGSPAITQQFGGLGLGLAISKALVEMHQGTIKVASEGSGKGSTFTVLLPQETPIAKNPSARSIPESDFQATGLRILLVEDHADTARTLSRLLRLAGYPVKAVNSIAAALEIASTEQFDVLISDLGLPDGTGIELMQEIRERYSIRGIAMSGFGMEEDIRKSKEAGFSEHLVKPLNFSQLRQAIDRTAQDLK